VSDVELSVALEGDMEPELYVRALQIVERYGFYSLQLYEHFGYRPAWATCFLLAPHVDKTRIGPVTVPSAHTHPFYTATQALYLAEATGGRAILGVSRGAFYERLAITPPTPFEALRDTLEILQAVFFDGCEEGYSGKVYSLPKGVRPLFHHRLRPKVYGGSSGPKTIKMICSYRVVEGVVVDNLWNPAYVPTVLRSMGAAASKRGHTQPLELVARPFCVVFEREEERGRARRLAEAKLAQYLPGLVDNSPMLEEAKISRGELEWFAAYPHSAGEVAERAVRFFCAFGTPEEIVEQADAMIRAGVNHICFGLPLGPDPLAAIDTLGRRVLPALRDTSK